MTPVDWGVVICFFGYVGIVWYHARKNRTGRN